MNVGVISRTSEKEHVQRRQRVSGSQTVWSSRIMYSTRVYPTWSPSGISCVKKRRRRRRGEEEEEEDVHRTEREHVNSYSMDTAM